MAGLEELAVALDDGAQSRTRVAAAIYSVIKMLETRAEITRMALNYKRSTNDLQIITYELH